MTPTRVGVQVIRDIRSSRRTCEEWIVRYQRREPGAAETLLRAHEPLVRMLVRRFIAPTSRDFSDAMQEGRMGMLHACERYVVSEDPTRHGGGSGYLAIWIRHHVSRYLMTVCQGVRVPDHHYDRLKHTEPRDSVWRPRTLLFCQMDVRSEESDYTFEEALVDDAPLADELLDGETIRTLTNNLAMWFLALCTQQEQDVLCRRLANGETLEAIGVTEGFSRENIRLIEARALAKCRRTTAAVLGVLMAHATYTEFVGIMARHATTEACVTAPPPSEPPAVAPRVAASPRVAFSARPAPRASASR